MALDGRLAPVILVPRYTTYLGPGVFPGFPIEVAAFEGARISLWRGILHGTTPAFGYLFEESTDRQTWSAVPGTSFIDPGEDLEQQYPLSLTKRWFRGTVSVQGTSSGATCWAQGYFVRREE
jgi:hypothetical protein